MDPSLLADVNERGFWYKTCDIDRLCNEVDEPEHMFDDEVRLSTTEIPLFLCVIPVPDAAV